MIGEAFRAVTTGALLVLAGVKLEWFNYVLGFY
jgi:hypothetical protein